MWVQNNTCCLHWSLVLLDELHDQLLAAIVLLIYIYIYILNWCAFWLYMCCFCVANWLHNTHIALHAEPFGCTQHHTCNAIDLTISLCGYTMCTNWAIWLQWVIVHVATTGKESCCYKLSHVATCWALWLHIEPYGYTCWLHICPFSLITCHLFGCICKCNWYWIKLILNVLCDLQHCAQNTSISNCCWPQPCGLWRISSKRSVMWLSSLVPSLVTLSLGSLWSKAFVPKSWT